MIDRNRWMVEFMSMFLFDLMFTSIIYAFIQLIVIKIISRNNKKKDPMIKKESKI